MCTKQSQASQHNSANCRSSNCSPILMINSKTKMNIVTQSHIDFFLFKSVRMPDLQLIFIGQFNTFAKILRIQTKKFILWQLSKALVDLHLMLRLVTALECQDILHYTKLYCNFGYFTLSLIQRYTLHEQETAIPCTAPNQTPELIIPKLNTMDVIKPSLYAAFAENSRKIVTVFFLLVGFAHSRHRTIDSLIIYTHETWFNPRNCLVEKYPWKES
jgi:hypothetical protein